ncbi:MAG TPA: metalloregulator ArsR/SmtB family transcription factor [Ktedonobacteraceae bacterium]|nr:metalloregulator ArsR/SmtB family transcription factor [Ktedonobacteraceae bacterium]
MIDSFSSTPSTCIALEPVFNALNSFSLLNQIEQLAGLNSWVVQTAAALTPEQRHINRLIFDGLCDALVPEKDMLDFPTYLSNLAEQDPDVLRKRTLERLRSRFSRRMQSDDAMTAPTRDRLLDDMQAYLVCAEYVQVDAPFDVVLQSEVHALLQDADALQRLLVSHLAMLWKETFATEWRRIRSSLNWQVEMFTRSIDEEATLEDEFQAFTGRELPPHLSALLSHAQEVILVPSWHTGRHVTLWEDDTTSARLFFSEPPNYDVAQLRVAPVRRGELKARLDALADETRLRIIDLLVQRNEMHAQDIIAELGLSQSSVSRHLKQLVSMGYLYERRSEGANKTYRLSSFYFARTAHAVEQLLTGEEKHQTHDEDTPQPHALGRFLDRSGKLTLWPPAKQRDKLLILEYLAAFFEPERVYNEKEVNDLLLLHSIVKDSAALRRALYEYRFMHRTRDGSQYWLIGSEMPEVEGQ